MIPFLRKGGVHPALPFFRKGGVHA